MTSTPPMLPHPNLQSHPGVAEVERGRPKWEENWRSNAAPLLLRLHSSIAWGRWALLALVFAIAASVFRQ